MSARRDAPVLDRFRLLAAFLAGVQPHRPSGRTGPEADFWLTRVLARIAVPFFPHGQRVLSFPGRLEGHGQIFEADADPLRRRSSALSAPELVQRGLLPLEWLKSCS